MRTSRTATIKYTAGRILIGLFLAVTFSGIDVTVALGRDDRGRMEQRDEYRYRERERAHERGRERYERRHYDRREREYAPPPAVFVPPQPPGISIFFPPIIIHP